MFCTKCGIDLKENDQFCSQCGTSTSARRATSGVPVRLSRPATGGKIAGVCAGFARYFDVDVTVVRVIWLAITLWPVPLSGVICYLVAWIVMPKDPVMVPVPQMYQTPQHQ